MADSRIELGHIITHQQTSRGGLRGSGFELGSLAETPSHLAWITPASAVAQADKHLQLTTQNDLHASAAHILASVSGQHV